MKAFHSFLASILLGVAVIGVASLTPVASVDAAGQPTGGQITVTYTRATSFPKIGARFTVTGPRGELIPQISADNLSVVEADQPMKSFTVYPLDQSPTPVNVVIAIDVSATMNTEGRLPAAKVAAKTFVSQLRPIDQVEVISFGNRVNVVAPFTQDQAAVFRGIDNLQAQGDVVFNSVTERSVNDVLRVAGNRMVVLVTDGQNMVSEQRLAPALDLARQTQVPIYTVGVGNNANDPLLRQMASQTGGHYFKAPQASDLQAIFKLLTQELTRQYELYYFSPLPHVAGKSVDVTLRITPGAARAGQITPPIEGHFSYVMPAVVQTDVEPVDPGTLKAVAGPPPARTGNSPFTPLEAAGAAAMALFAAVFGLRLRLVPDAYQARMSAFVAGVTRTIYRDPWEGQGGLFAALLDWLAGLATHILPARQLEQLRMNLDLAGHPYGWGTQQFLGMRMLLAIGMALLGYVAGAQKGFLIMVAFIVALGVLGYLLPAIWLGAKIRARQRAIFRAMPNALDLISTTVEAGLGFDQAVTEVVRKWQNELTREFAIFLAEMQMGRNRREALRAITERTGVPELSGFVSAVIQADELGAGIAQTLAIQAEQIRIKRRQHAEKLAQQAAVKMIFPMVFLIFPSIFVVILGPSIPQLVEMFSNLGK